MSSESNVRALHVGVLLSRSAFDPLKRKELQLASAKKVERCTPESAACNRSHFLPWPFGELSAEKIAQRIGVGVPTARRWRRERTLPKPIRLLAHILMTGDLGPINAAWAGWSVRNGALHSHAHREPLTVSELEFLPFTAQRTAALEATICRLELELKNAKSTEPPANSELLKAIGRTELLARMAAATADEFGQAEHESVRTFQPAAAEAARSMAMLLMKVSHRAKCEAPLLS